MELNKFLESEVSAKEFIEDAVMSTAISTTTDNPDNPVRHPALKGKKEVNKLVDIK